jgi:nitrous oxide reductase accessory protein NosL
VPAVWAGDALPKPGPKDKCPVCGMFVAKYPDWTASLRFASGEQAFFDGVKDLLKFHFNMGRYAPGKTPADIATIQVTDYYSLEPIDGRTAFYVVGSDVFGPMGKELIPFAQRAQAEEFLKDHKGLGIHAWSEIGPDVLKALE